MPKKTAIQKKLHELIEARDSQQAIQLIKDHPLLINQPINGIPTIYFAAEKKCLALVEYLVDNGADMEAKYNGYTSLFVAAQNGYLSIVRYLISKGADVKAKGNDGATVLYIAAQHGKAKIVDYLLAHGAEGDAPFKKGFTPLFVAARAGYTEIVASLIKAKADIDANKGDGATSLYVAAQNNYAEVVELLACAGANVETPFMGCTAFYIAARLGHLQVLETLKRHSANIHITCNDIRPLYAAVQNNHMSVVKALLDYGVDVNEGYMGFAPLCIAAKLGNIPMLKILIEHQAMLDKPQNGKTALHIAAHCKKEEAVELLLASGAKASNLDLMTLKTSQNIAIRLLEAQLAETGNLNKIFFKLYSTQAIKFIPNTVADHFLSLLKLNKIRKARPYIKKIRTWLIKLEKDMKETAWKVKASPITEWITKEKWVPGTPGHIETMAAQLKNLKACKTYEVVVMYADIIKQLSSITYSDNRHEDTAAFYKRKLAELQADFSKSKAFDNNPMQSLTLISTSLPSTLFGFTSSTHRPITSTAGMASSSNALLNNEMEMIVFEEVPSNILSAANVNQQFLAAPNHQISLSEISIFTQSSHKEHTQKNHAEVEMKIMGMELGQ